MDDTTLSIPPASKITFSPLPASSGQLEKRFESTNDSKNEKYSINNLDENSSLKLNISKHLEETLNYLKSTFNIDKIKTIQCTQKSQKKYVNSNETEFQASVLDLPVQLLLLRVHYNLLDADEALQLLTVIVSSVRSEVDKWKCLSQQIVDVRLVHLQSNVFLGSIFIKLTNFDHHTINQWLMNINIILRCLVQNSTEDIILTPWNDALSSVNRTRDEDFPTKVFKMIYL
ncbi:unnamed protein product [Rotaria sp. Silwood1]|nr:unnamed protein product [Rotaria sp. Silwood1]CAF3759343.1 unnamed protein product [Rotaria sp. Silwood1]CAF3795708.1 unnamed protein product [Rotaria sp. Silwood1]CAF4632210.1 unnamed protein product [Rotaria sp. Silwood1]CAF4768254.1 unnamed protein product [Rotaria sp. Silwood1]